jgi:hypothetical protein
VRGLVKCPNQIQRDAPTILEALKISQSFQCIKIEEGQIKAAQSGLLPGL